MKLKLTIKPFVMIKIYPKLLTNSLPCNIGPTLASEVTNMTINNVETYLENNESIIPSFRFMPIPV